MWFNERDYVLVVIVLIKLYLGFKVSGIETVIFNLKNVEGYGRRNGEGLEHALRHAFEAVKRQNN
jgi:hypothetical protein